MALAKKETPRKALKKSKTMFLPVTSLACVESLSLPLVQEVVISADISCADCQKRVADVMSRMNETESVLVNVLEKRVTLTCRYPAAVVKIPSGQVASLHRNPLRKIAMIKRIFGPSCG